MLSFVASLLLALDDAATLDLMRRVAENVEKPNPLRREFVYTQKTHARLLRTNAKVAREERREYHVLPKEDGVEHKMVAFEGFYEKGKKLLPYDDPEFRQKKLDLDGELIEDFIDDHTADGGSRDGIKLEYFPIRTKDLEFYNFEFVAEQTIENRRAARIRFAPKSKNWQHLWEGETIIDLEDAFPLRIQTKMARKLPAAVRTLMGTNLKQFGFNVTFTRLEKDLWFPKTFGTEFQIDLFFGYKRVVAMSMESSDFRRTNAASTIAFEGVESKP
jgi:hypothetical protein